MQNHERSPHRLAWSIYMGKLPEVLKMLGFQLLLRLIALLPFLYGVWSGQFLQLTENHAPAVGLLFSLPLYALLVMPFRFQAAARKAQLQGLPYESGVTLPNYLRWLKAALLRLLMALPFLLPFLAFAVLFYYYMRVPGFNDSLMVIQKVGGLVGGEFLTGILLLALTGIAAVCLAVFGWWRGLAFEHQAVLEQGIRLSLKKARQARKARGRLLRKTQHVNLLLALPALLGVVGVLALQVLSLPRSGMLAFDFLNALSMLMTINFPGSTLLILLILLLVLWLPLLPPRKLAISAALGEAPGN